MLLFSLSSVSLDKKRERSSDNSASDVMDNFIAKIPLIFLFDIVYAPLKKSQFWDLTIRKEKVKNLINVFIPRKFVDAVKT